MAAITRAATIAAPPEAVWDVLADFGAISSWAGNVDHSCLLQHGSDVTAVGTTRRVQVGRNTLVERITESAAPRVLAYEVEGLPRRLHRVVNRWTVSPGATGTSTVRLSSTVEIGRNPLARLAERAVCRMMAAQSDAMLAGLAGRLEGPP